MSEKRIEGCDRVVIRRRKSKGKEDSNISDGDVSSIDSSKDYIPVTKGNHSENRITGRIDARKRRAKEQIESKKARIAELADILGYDVDEIKRLQDELAAKQESGEVANKSLRMWIKYCQQNMQDITLEKGMAGERIEQFVVAVAMDRGKRIECNVYPMFILGGYGSSNHADIIVDIDVDPLNESSESLPIIIKLTAAADGEQAVVNIDTLHARGINIDVPKDVMEGLSDDSQKLNQLAVEVLESAHDMFKYLHNGENSGLVRRNIPNGRKVYFASQQKGRSLPRVLSKEEKVVLENLSK